MTFDYTFFDVSMLDFVTDVFVRIFDEPPIQKQYKPLSNFHPNLLDNLIAQHSFFFRLI
jgi:hypothetical protein